MQRSKVEVETVVFWTNPFRASVMDALEQLGLSACAVCDGEVFTVLSQPIVMSLGGPYEHDPLDRGHEDALLHYVAVVCEVCGNTLFFDQGKFRTEADTVLEARSPARQAGGPPAGPPP